jgi:hypothetical protein
MMKTIEKKGIISLNGAMSPIGKSKYLENTI